MLFKPTYCCSCGDKIERVEWRLLTSRRFCDLCETEYKFDDWLPRIMGLIALMFGVWGIGSYLNRPTDSIDISRSRVVRSSKFQNNGESKSRGDRPISNSQSFRDSQRGKSEKVDRLDTTPRREAEKSEGSETVSVGSTKKTERKRLIKEVSDPIYFCGAETKKGTPCSRKVKGKKRCWQHEGREAILPQNELIVGGQ